jgi:hypothetical protein
MSIPHGSFKNNQCTNPKKAYSLATIHERSSISPSKLDLKESFVGALGFLTGQSLKKVNHNFASAILMKITHRIMELHEFHKFIFLIETRLALADFSFACSYVDVHKSL